MRQRTSVRIVGLLTLCVFLKGCGSSTAPQVDTVQNAAGRAASYLVKSTRDNGMFEYRVNMDPAVRMQEKYNILRHAGTIYAMSMYHGIQPGNGLRPAMERAGRYLLNEAIEPVPGDDELLAVWSKPEVNGSGNPLQAKLGGTGLSLVALLSMEQFHPGFTPLADLQALGRFVVHMQKEDGSFYSKYIPSMGGRWDEWTSLYYPGEAALGLVMLHEKDSSGVWLESAGKALAYLARSREGSNDVPIDHWALLATARILALESDDRLPVSKELLIGHALQICDAILQSQITDAERSEYDGGFSVSGKTTPTATRLEGLQAALLFLPPNHEIRQRINTAVGRGISFLLQAQVKEGEFAGALPRAVAKIPPTARDADEFNQRATEVRIDYVQHALSAMIQYLHLTRDRNP